MNRFVFIMMLLPACALAQWKTLPAQPFIRYQSFITTDTSKPTIRLLAQAERSHRTSQGTVYLMQPDGMPCLVPPATANAPMPRKSMPSNERMPNKIQPPRQKLNKE